MSETNAWLADQAGRDDPTAFAKLMRRHHGLVFEVCMRMLGHRQDAEDATQDTFSRLAKYLNRWDRRRPLEPWLVTIAGNRCRTLLARKRPLQSLTVVAEPATTIENDRQDAESLAEEVRLAMRRLPAEQRLAIELFHEQSLSYEQIARRMNRPLGTIKTWVYRGRLALIDSLREREVVDVPTPCDSTRTEDQS